MRTLALALAALALGAAACAGSQAAPEGASGDPARLYRAKCTGCHRPYERGSRRAADWAVVLERMAPRAKLTPAQRESLMAWLRAGASDASKEGGR